MKNSASLNGTCRLGWTLSARLYSDFKRVFKLQHWCKESGSSDLTSNFVGNRSCWRKKKGDVLSSRWDRLVNPLKYLYDTCCTPTLINLSAYCCSINKFMRLVWFSLCIKILFGWGGCCWTQEAQISLFFLHIC